VLKSQPLELRLVPRNKLSVPTCESLSTMKPFFEQSIEPIVSLLRFCVEFVILLLFPEALLFFSFIATIDATDPRSKPLPKIIERDEVVVYESAHFYEVRASVFFYA